MSDLTPQEIMQLGLGFWGSKTLLSAIELGVFTELAQGDLEAEVLTERLQLNSRGASDFLDALVALSMLKSHQRPIFQHPRDRSIFGSK